MIDNFVTVETEHKLFPHFFLHFIIHNYFHFPFLYFSLIRFYHYLASQTNNHLKLRIDIVTT